MPDAHDNAYSRRLFLQQGLTLASLAFTAPLFIERSAHGLMRPLGSPLSSHPGIPEDRVLVVVQLGGGNDGLNTVIPYFSDVYYRERPSLAIPAPGRSENSAIQLDRTGGLGVHPNFAGFKELMDQGVASIVQGVGYPNPNRSHFTSMDIWHTADTGAHGPGWIGRYFDNTCCGAPEPNRGVAIMQTAPRAMTGREHAPVTFTSPDAFRWAGEDVHDDLAPLHEELARLGHASDRAVNNQVNFLTRTALDARISSETIRRAVEASPPVSYPNTRFAQQLQIIGSMIRAGMSTRVYYVSIGGFDTHANQIGTHARLMRELGDGLNAFYKDLKAQGNSGRVLTMAFSEFGRRVAQNASQGTDHGTAAPMYMIGDMVRPGLLGRHPTMEQLDQGDLVFNVDFRSIYASIIEDWMGAPSRPILGGAFRKAKILRT